jgi:DNA-directed RNA polymerase subunit beta
MREEDDDLLRAAEELGIDLSGVRATDGQAADEGTETADDTDAGAPEAIAEETPGDEPLAAVADEDLSEDDA